MGYSQQQINNFINSISGIAQEQAKKHHNQIFASVCIAQACLETGYGTSTKMLKANAIFGIKVGNSSYKFGTAWKGLGYSTKTKEVYSGQTQVITDLFRAYNSLADSIEDYFDMLCHCARYKQALNQTSPYLCITGIKNGGYATDPNYVSKVVSIINANNLTRFDTNVIVDSIPDINYLSGMTYMLHSNMYIRDAAEGDKVDYYGITTNAQLNAFTDDEGFSILKKGTKVTCKSTKIIGNNIWMEIPSGWVCAKQGNKIYIE